jgi:hypothetical protein
MIQKYTDGLRTVIFTKCMMLCCTWLTCVFGGLSIFIALCGIAGSCHPWLVSYGRGISIKKGRIVHSLVYCFEHFFRSCLYVVFGCF